MKSLKGFKKANKITLLLTSFFITFFIFTFILAKVSFTANEPVNTQTWILEKDVIHEIGVTKTCTVSNDAGGLQGNVVTHKHIVFASLWIDDSTSDSHIYFIDKSTGTINTSLTINVPHSAVSSSDSIYGHMNDMTYNPNTGEIFIPFLDPSDNIPKAAIITYTDKTAGTINKNNTKVVTIPTPQNVSNVSGMAYNENYGYIFRFGKQIWIAQRDGDGFSSNLTTFSIGSSEIEKSFYYMTGQGIFSYEDYLYVTLFECGQNNASLQKYYYDTTEKGSNITLVYKINSSKTGATFLKALYIPGAITNYSLDSNNRLSELETGSFDPQTGDIYFGYNITRVSGETNKAKIFYKQNLGNQIVNGKSTYFYPSGLPKTQSSITGENMVVTDNLLRYYNANSNSSNNSKDLNITWKDLSNTNDALILGKQSSEQAFSNGSVFLDGTDDWVNMGNITGIYSKVTLETQFKLSSLPNYSSHIISNAEQGGYILYINPSGKPGFNAYIDGAYVDLILDESINLNQVYNLTAVFDGRYLKIYLGGTEKKSLDLGSTKTVGIPASNTVMAIGANPVGNSANAGYANATIYSARVYSSALTAAQIKQNINADRVTPNQLSVNSKNLTLTINFSQAVNSLSTSDLTIQNGTVSSITKISDYKYNVSISNVAAESTLSISTKNTTTDIAGNNIEAGTSNIYIDVPKATAPSVTAYNKAYDGASHTVTVSGGSGGTIQYSIDNQSWSSTAPTYKDFTNGPKAIYVKVAGDSTHCDSDVITSSVTITKKSITIPSSPVAKTYNGSSQNSEITAPENTSIVTESSTTSATNAGTYNVVLKLNDTTNYQWSDGTTENKTITWTIDKYSLRDATVYAPYQIYDGTRKMPEPTVKMDTTIINSSEYNVSYSNNINVGTASFTISAKSSSTNFKGSKAGTFSIERASITIPSSQSGKIYNGSSQSSGIATPANTSIVAATSTTSATNAGTYSIEYKLNDTSNYKWSDGTITNKTVNWTIRKFNLSDATLSAANQTYDGTQKRPTVYVKIGTSFTIPSSEYNIIYSNNINAGTANFTVNSKSTSANYTGSIDGTFTINKYNLSNATLSVANQIYDGTQKTPAPTIKMGSKTISSDEYDVDYSNNINAGTANIIVTAKTTSTNFTGSKSGTFSIGKANITAPSSPANKTYNGSNQSSEITTPENTSIVTGSSTTNATNAGIYSVVIKLNDSTNYQWSDGTTTNKTVTWTINKYNLNNATVSAASQAYDGTPKTPSPIVKMGSTTIASSEYDVSYSNNINEGTANFTVTAKSSSANYTGSKSGTFIIGKATITIPSSPAAKTYNGSSQNSEIIVPENTSIVTTDSTTNATNAGTYSVVLKLDDTTNSQWNDGTTSNKVITWTINKYNLINANLAIMNQTFDGSAKMPSPTVEMGRTLISSTEYDVSYLNNTNAGTASFTITAKNSSINFTGSKTGSFTITKATVEEPSNPVDKTYNGLSQSSGITIPTNTSIVTENSTTSATNAGTYNVIIKLNDTSNYQWNDGTTENKTITWTINKYSLTNATIASISDKNYSGSAITPTPSVTVPIPSGSTTTLTSGTHFTYSYTNNINPTNNAKVTITAKDTSNYSGSRDVTFVINPRVKYNSNGGSGTMNDQYVSYNEITTLNQNTFSNTGYIFGGWASSQENANQEIVACEDKGTVQLTSNITLYAIWIPDNYEILDYTVDDNNISDISPNTTIAEFKEHIVLNSTGNVKIFDKDGNELTDDTSIISTGMSIKIILAEKTNEFSIIVTGDVDGNGIVDIHDLICINKHRLEKTSLEGIYLIAGDINKDNTVSIIDLLQLNKFRLGKITL